MDLIGGVIGHLISALVGGAATWLWKVREARTPYATVTGLTSRDKIIIVVPERPLPEGVGKSYETQRVHVTFVR